MFRDPGPKTRASKDSPDFGVGQGGRGGDECSIGMPNQGGGIALVNMGSIPPTIVGALVTDDQVSDSIRNK